MHYSPLIHEKFTGFIWRLIIDEITETLLLEIRENENRQVSFASLSLKTGKPWFNNYTHPERWLTGLETGFDGVMLLHNYLSETGPAHKGLSAVDAFSGDILWSNYNIAFDHLTTEGPVVYDTRVHPHKLFLADIKTGAITRIYEPSVYRERESHLIFPEVISGEELAFKLKGLHTYGNTAYYLDHNNERIVSLHTLNKGMLNQLLLVFTDNDEVYRDLLNTDIQKMQPEAFIMHKNRLIYIKNKSELVVISL